MNEKWCTLKYLYISLTVCKLVQSEDSCWNFTKYPTGRHKIHCSSVCHRSQSLCCLKSIGHVMEVRQYTFFFFPLCLFKNQTIILTVKLHPNSVLRTVCPINGANDLVVAQTGGKLMVYI